MQSEIGIDRDILSLLRFFSPSFFLIISGENVIPPSWPFSRRYGILSGENKKPCGCINHILFSFILIPPLGSNLELFMGEKIKALVQVSYQQQNEITMEYNNEKHRMDRGALTDRMISIVSCPIGVLNCNWESRYS